MKDVCKSLLSGMTDDELYVYLHPENRSASIAVRYAYEILLSRGRVFTPEEDFRIQQMIADRKDNEVVVIGENHRGAATLLYISAGLTFLSFVLAEDFDSLFIPLVVIGFLLFLGMLAGRGADWVKYLLLLSFGFGFFLPVILTWLVVWKPLIALIVIIQTILHVWALLLLFLAKLSK
ncbi:MAG TPA: hypothetical protein PKA53_13800 [Sphingobacterium sp.]|nr:hypothetical protein [Sphingobacterium sp.]